MRRFIALLIMLIVPLQFAWASAVGVYGHAGQDIAATGFHTHGHDHGHHGDVHHDHDAPVDSKNQEHDDEEHHDHTHPVFSSLLATPGLPLTEPIPGGPILQPPTGFLSRTPPLLDRPPLARA
jgi:hypothetical protein